MKRLVMKFGGTSVGTGKNIRKVVNIIKDNKEKGHEIIIVVSALAQVTNLLIEIAEKVKNGNEEQIKKFIVELIERHEKVIEDAINSEKIESETKK